MSNVPTALMGVMAHYYAAAKRRARALAAHPDSPAQNWQPYAERWSILQCIQHLALTNRLIGRLVDRAI